MCVSSEIWFFVCCIFRQKSKKIDAKVSKKMFLEIAPECWLKVLFPEKKHVFKGKTFVTWKWRHEHREIVYLGVIR